MRNNPRCLYDKSIAGFLNDPEDSVFGLLCDHYHGEALTTTREAWREEISVMKTVLPQLEEQNTMAHP